MSAATVTPALRDVDWASFDFLDLGSSRGDSLDYGKLRFGGNCGLGIDLNPHKVQIARKRGLDIVQGDATRLGIHKQVRFVLMMDFLEHLPSLEIVEKTLIQAAAAATDFVFIFHPSFEGEEYLASRGLRLHWWNWRVHTAHITIADYCQMFDRVGLHQYMIRYVKPITDSDHPAVLTMNEARDEYEWDPARHAPKPAVAFARPVWRAQEIFIALSPFEPSEWALITRPWKQTALVSGARAVARSTDVRR